MDDYGRSYVDPCYPLVVLAGLAQGEEEDAQPSAIQRNGLKLGGTGSNLSKDTADRIWNEFERFGVRPSGAAPDEKSGASNAQLYVFRRCGNEYSFPTRKAVSQASPADIETQEIMSPGANVLHSPLSPLSPGSPLYPDGVMTPLWMQKHRQLTPAFVLFFYQLSTDEKMQSLHDNQLKQEINTIRLRLDESSYKTRLGVVLLSDTSVADDPDLEERLNNIKRTTKLDSKSGFFFIQTNANQAALTSLVEPIVFALRPPALEYYRDLTRHARRKRDRGSPAVSSTPNTPGVSQGLSRSSWNARHEFKMGVFADYRQEPDVAARHYNTALDSLFHPEGFFENVTNWSPRWNETRKFADILAIRFIRCQLINGLPSSAVMFWNHYRSRISSILTRKGKGTSDYGWLAWEARWSVIMAELTTNYTPVSTDQSSKKSSTGSNPIATAGSVYFPAERQILSDDPLHPWHLLHHSGYWYKLGATFTRARRWLAAKIPVEDRLPPGQSPAAAVARRSERYDTYLCPDPPEEYEKIKEGGSVHDDIIVKLLGEAMNQFSQHDQARMSAFLKLSLGKHLLTIEKHDDAYGILKSIWQDNPWRQAQWFDLVRDASLSLHLSALKTNDLETQVATLWELSHQSLHSVDGLNYNIARLLNSDDRGERLVRLESLQADCLVSAICLFDKTQGHAGEPTPARIILHSRAHAEAQLIPLEAVELEFEGNLLRIIIQSSLEGTTLPSAETKNAASINLELSDGGSPTSTWTGKTDLTLAPNQTKVFKTRVVIRETGLIVLKSASIKFKSDRTTIEQVTTVSPSGQPARSRALERFLPGIRTLRSSPQQLEVLPKPPKLEIHTIDLEKVYYTDEMTSITIELFNHEAETAHVNIGVRLLGGDEGGFKMKWVEDDEFNEVPHTKPLQWAAGALGAAATSTRTITLQIPSLPADTSLEVHAHYYLDSDRNTPISKIATADAIVVCPFEPSFAILPMIQPDAWPDFFSIPDSDANETPAKAIGIATRWSITASLASYASTALVVSDISLFVSGVGADGQARVLDTNDDKVDDRRVEPKEQIERVFTLDMQKADLDERRATTATAKLDVAWRRAGAETDELVHTVLEVPRMSFPSGEPRVLAALVPASAPSKEGDVSVLVDFVLENPSLHFLSFGITMELSEEYAFSGPKAKTLHLLPMSRRTLRYTFVPLGSGEKQRLQPKLSVVDLYFNKKLEVQATKGLDADEEGLLIWVGGDDNSAT
ncbi:hypothetical protein FH972_021988 [Carpinus fangiana]|uniref:Trafficking protein particle complex subunit 11 domain-containing protein n=1 Tax=Carpinus fangiana TaxID=176857 RepID=A0A5N6KQX7_9ROSI|nr:hypothetical protein FH972_021988 [Carpinus fangiana]